MVFSTASFPPVFPKKRLELKSLTGQTKAEEGGTRSHWYFSNSRDYTARVRSRITYGSSTCTLVLQVPGLGNDSIRKGVFSFLHGYLYCTAVGTISPFLTPFACTHVLRARAAGGTSRYGLFRFSIPPSSVLLNLVLCRSTKFSTHTS
jgi:hypothetical protein